MNLRFDGTLKGAVRLALVAGLCCFFALALNAQRKGAPPETVLLWPDGAPGAVGHEDLDQPTLALFPVPESRSTGAAVVPAMIFETGRWRYEVTVFDAVPQETIDAGDVDAAARYVVDCLYPPVAERPEQAMAVLIETIRRQPG